MYFCFMLTSTPVQYIVVIMHVAVQIDRYGPHKSKMVVINICGFIHTELRKKDTFYIVISFSYVEQFSGKLEQL